MLVGVRLTAADLWRVLAECDGPSDTTTATKAEMHEMLDLMLRMRRMEVSFDNEYKVGHTLPAAAAARLYFPQRARLTWYPRVFVPGPQHPWFLPPLRWPGGHRRRH